MLLAFSDDDEYRPEATCGRWLCFETYEEKKKTSLLNLPWLDGLDLCLKAHVRTTASTSQGKKRWSGDDLDWQY